MRASIEAVKCTNIRSGPVSGGRSVPRPLWKDRPAWFLVAEQDRMIVQDNQRFMAARNERHAVGGQLFNAFLALSFRTLPLIGLGVVAM